MNFKDVCFFKLLKFKCKFISSPNDQMLYKFARLSERNRNEYITKADLDNLDIDINLLFNFYTIEHLTSKGYIANTFDFLDSPETFKHLVILNSTYDRISENVVPQVKSWMSIFISILALIISILSFTFKIFG